jgi:arylsulfatase A-like enzyme
MSNQETPAPPATPKPRQRRAPANPRGALFFAATATALTVGFVDTILALAAIPDGFPTFHAAFPSLALLVAATFVAFFGLVIAASIVVPPKARARRLAFHVALAGFTVAFFTLLCIGDLNAISAFTADPLRAGVKAGLLAAVAIGAGIGAYRIADRLEPVAGAQVTLLCVIGLGTIALGAAAAIAVLRHTDLAPLPGHTIGAIIGTTTAGLGLLSLLIVRLRVLWAVRVLLAMSLLAVLGSPALSYLRDWAPQPVDLSAVRRGHDVPRVILITVDTLRRDALTCYDPAGAGTPSLDALADDSVMFTDAYTPAPWTIPSLVSVMTGVSADVHGVNEDAASIPPQLPTLAEHFTEAGYLTTAIGYHPQLLRMGRGFQVFDFLPQHLPLHEETTGGKTLWRLLRKERSTETLTDEVCAWLGAHRTDDFFLWVHYLDPHHPYAPPQRFLPDDPLIRRFGTEHKNNIHFDIRAGRDGRTPDEQRWLRMLYDGEVRLVDECIGRVVATAKKLGIYDDALIVVTSDHGEEFWEHGNVLHGQSLYDELVRAPLLVKLPQGGPRRPVEQTVSTDALLPTILDVCGLDDEPAVLTSRSLAPLWGPGGYAVPTPPVFLGCIEYYAPREAVVHDGFKLIRWLETGKTELYDLDHDPGEQHPVTGLSFEALDLGVTLVAERPEEREIFSAMAPGRPVPVDTMDESLLRSLRAIGYTK